MHGHVRANNLTSRLLSENGQLLPSSETGNFNRKVSTSNVGTHSLDFGRFSNHKKCLQDNLNN